MGFQENIKQRSVMHLCWWRSPCNRCRDICRATTSHPLLPSMWPDKEWQHSSWATQRFLKLEGQHWNAGVQTSLQLQLSKLLKLELCQKLWMINFWTATKSQRLSNLIYTFFWTEFFKTNWLQRFTSASSRRQKQRKAEVRSKSRWFFLQRCCSWPCFSVQVDPRSTGHGTQVRTHLGIETGLATEPSSVSLKTWKQCSEIIIKSLKSSSS